MRLILSTNPNRKSGYVLGNSQPSLRDYSAAHADMSRAAYRKSGAVLGPRSFAKNQKSHKLRPKRTRISYFAEPTKSTYAAFFKESRRNFANATNLDRKSGAA